MKVRNEEKVNDTEADHIPLSKVSNPQMLTLGCAMSWRLIQGCTLASPTAAGTPSLTLKPIERSRKEEENIKSI